MGAKALSIEGHWLTGVRRVESPNQDDRPPDTPIELVVIHGISLPPNAFGEPHVEQLFTNRLDPSAHPYFAEIAHLMVSAHLFIRRDGGLVQFVPFDRRAWHAGVSSWRGRSRCNDFSIGIELEGADHIPYTAHQYRQLNRVLALLRRNYPICDVVGHSHIAPGRKTDPGPAFDWQRVHGASPDLARRTAKPAV